MYAAGGCFASKPQERDTVLRVIARLPSGEMAIDWIGSVLSVRRRIALLPTASDQMRTGGESSVSSTAYAVSSFFFFARSYRLTPYCAVKTIVSLLSPFHSNCRSPRAVVVSAHASPPAMRSTHS